MKKLNAFLVSVLAAVTLNAATIEQVIVRQQWPWSTDIKVEYKLSAVTNPVDIAVEAYNGSEKLTFPEAAITGDRYGISEDGVGTLVIDPVAAFGTAKIALANFKVKLTVSDSSSNLNETIYRVYDLVGGGRTDITRKEILNGKYGSYETNYKAFGADFETPVPAEELLIWTAVTNDLAYMTTKLVMRKIPATKQVWQVGQNGSKYVKLTEDFFMGVFPVTVEQDRLINGGGVKTELTGDMVLPKDSMSVVTTRGTRTPGASPGRNMIGRVTGEAIYWPTNSYVHDVAGASALGRLRDKFEIDFDLPSLAQWEVAARAGSVSDLYNGKASTQANAEELGWISTNSGGSLKRVGLKAPNPYGLYDIYGNVAELTPCMNAFGDQPDKGTTTEDPYVDPVGSVTGGNIYKGGGSAELNSSWANSWNHNGWYGWYEAKPFVGYRVVVPADSTTWKQ